MTASISVMLEPPEIGPKLIFLLLGLIKYGRLLFGNVFGLTEDSIEPALIPHLLLALGHVAIPFLLESIQGHLEGLVGLIILIEINQNTNGRSTTLATGIFDEINLIFGVVLFLFITYVEEKK